MQELSQPSAEMSNPPLADADADPEVANTLPAEAEDGDASKESHPPLSSATAQSLAPVSALAVQQSAPQSVAVELTPAAEEASEPVSLPHQTVLEVPAGLPPLSSCPSIDNNNVETPFIDLTDADAIELQWTNTAEVISRRLSDLYRHQLGCDLILQSSEEEGSVPVHSAVVLSLCGTTSWLAKHCFDLLRNEDKVVLILPWAKTDALRALVDFIYFGTVIFQESRIKELQDIANYLGLQDVGSLLYFFVSNPGEVHIRINESEKTATNSEASDVPVNSTLPATESCSESFSDFPFSESSEETRRAKPRRSSRFQSKEFAPPPPNLSRRNRELDQALERIVNGESVTKVSSDTGIPRASLYKSVHKRGIKLPTRVSPMTAEKYSSRKMSRAFDHLGKGRSLSEVERLVDVPKAAIWRRVKRRLHSHPNDERLMKYNATKDKRYTDEALKEAGEKIAAKEITISAAARKYAIPKSSLLRQVKRIEQAVKK